MRKSSAQLSALLFASTTLSGCNLLVPDSKTDANFHPGASPVTDGSGGAQPAPFSWSWSFDAASEALYTFSASFLRFASGLVSLIGTDQIDDDNTATGFAGGSAAGVVWDTNRLKLGNAGGCDATSTNCAELDASWTPRWANLVGYWKMNELSWNGNIGELLDSSGQNNHGTALGANTITNAKLGENAGTFGGGQWVQLPGASLSGAEGSISFWVKTSDFQALYNTHSGDWNQNTLFAGDGGTIVLRICEGSECPDIVSTSSITDNSWHHVAVTWKSGESRSLYIDGVQEATSVGTGTFTPGSDLEIGFCSWGCGYLNGQMDDLSVWSKELNASEIKTIYERQSSGIAAKYGGIFTSRVMDALSISSWTTFSWIPTLPFFKELPNYTTSIQNETSTNYSSLASDTLMTGLIGLWHLNEIAAGTVAAGAADFEDSSGNGNHGLAQGSTAFGASGRLRNAPTFDGGSSVGLPESPFQLPSDFTISAWFRSLNDGAIISKHECGYANGYWLDVGYRTGVPGQIGFYHNALPNDLGSSATNYNDGRWHHVAVTRAGATFRLYVDGAFDVSMDEAGTPNVDNTIPVALGQIVNCGAASLIGSIDEVGVWSRALLQNEVKQLYQRGASRLKFQVRTCDDSACAGETWQGPDGTSGTYFSELNNNSASLPSMIFSGFASQPSANRYFQYRTIFETDSNDLALGPELKSVRVDPIHYPNEATVYGNNGVSFDSLSAFTETLGAGGCASGIGYNLSIDKTNWKYWNGSAWVAANGTVAQSNPAAVIATNAASFGSYVGKGTVYFKAFLKSSGTSKCELDKVQIDGAR